MKHFWRIAITVVVLVAVGFTCYFLFFKPDSDLETFTKLADTIDKRDSLGVDSKLYELYKFDGHGSKYIRYHRVKLSTDQTKGDVEIDGLKYNYVNKNLDIDRNDETYFKFSSEQYPDIINYRNMLFYKGIPSENVEGYKIEIDTNGNKIYTYVAIEESLDNIFDYYFAYAQVMDDVKNSDQKAMNKTIKSYNTALSEFDSQLNSVLNYQSAYNFNVTEGKDKVSEIISTVDSDFIIKEYSEYDANTNLSGKIELTSRYLELVKSYRNLLSKKCDMIEKLKDMVIKYVFDGEFIVEASTVKMDLSLMVVSSAVSSEFKEYESNLMLLNATHFIDIYMGVGDFKNGSSADDVLEKYNSVVKNAKNDLKYVLSLSNAQLNLFADNATDVKDITSKLNQTYVSALQGILKAYGFGI